MNKREELYHMTDEEMVRLKVIERLLKEEISIKDAADVLGLSERQIKRIKKKVRLNGPIAIIHGNRKRKPINAVENTVKDLVVKLKYEKYLGTNFSHFAELLEEREGIVLSQPTVHRILRNAGIASPRKKKKLQAHHYRKRKACPGMMVQIDSSPYSWLGTGELSLHGAIDDASSNVLGLYLCKQETLEGYFEVTRQMVKGYGIPVSIYSDRHTIFFNPKGKLTIEEELDGKTEPYTQFSMAMGELAVKMIPAGSPQAKGRIERLWGTLQDRLVQEFNLNKIKEIDDANKFLKNYVKKFNKKFSVKPKGDPIFREPGKEVVLDYILCGKIPRKLDGGSAFSYRGKYFQLVSGKKPAITIPRSKISVLTSSRIGIKAEYSGRVYSVARLEARPKVTMDTKVKTKIRELPKRPADTHPWKNCGFNRYDRREEKIAIGLFDSTIAWENDNY
jgi:transposase